MKRSNWHRQLNWIRNRASLCRRYTMGAITVAVGASEESVFDECNDVLLPCLADDPAQSTTAWVFVHRDEQLFRESFAGLPALGTPACDYSEITDYWLATDEDLIFAAAVASSPSDSHLVIVRPSERAIWLLAANESPDGVELSRWVGRIVREVFLRLSEDHDHLLVHCGACSIHERGLMLPGPTGSGKSSFVAALVRAHVADYVSSDMCLVGPAADGIVRLRGWPQSVRLGVGLLERLPEFGSHLDAPGSLRRRQPDAATINKTRRLKLIPRWYADVKLDLSRREFLDAVNSVEACSPPLAALIFPRIVPESRKLSFRSLAHDEALERLNEQVLSPAGRSAFNWLGLRRDDITTARQRANAMVRKIASSHPAFELVAGPTAISDPQELASRIQSELR